MPLIIITKSRKDLVRKQKAIIDYVNQKSDPTSPQVKEAFQDLQRWNEESGIYKDTRGNEHIAHFAKERSKNGKKSQETKEIIKG